MFSPIFKELKILLLKLTFWKKFCCISNFFASLLPKLDLSNSALGRRTKRISRALLLKFVLITLYTFISVFWCLSTHPSSANPKKTLTESFASWLDRKTENYLGTASSRYGCDKWHWPCPPPLSVAQSTSAWPSILSPALPCPCPQPSSKNQDHGLQVTQENGPWSKGMDLVCRNCSLLRQPTSQGFQGEARLVKTEE